MKIAIAGGTGLVGHHVTEVAGQRGHEVTVLTRATGVDVLTGAGLADRLSGVAAVIDVLNLATQRRAEAERFFTTTTAHLVAAGTAAGVGHHVTLSIIGVDRVASGYYQGKLAQEAALAEGAVPWTVLRTAQFHEFSEQALGFVRLGPLSLVPQMLVQPVAAREVAAALVDLAEQAPLGHAPELAGPERLSLVDVSRQVNRARNLGRRVLPLRVPGAGGRAMRSGALLPTQDGPRGVVTFAQWLAD